MFLQMKFRLGEGGERSRDHKVVHEVLFLRYVVGRYARSASFNITAKDAVA
jgi:hypothetical protein